jgi:hypothetical protein
MDDSLQVAQGASSKTTLTGIEKLAAVPTASSVPITLSFPASVRRYEVPNTVPDEASSAGDIGGSEGVG